MTTIATPTVCTALLACHTRLDGITFTANTDTGRTPKVFYCGEFDDTSIEWVRLLGQVEDDAVDHVGAGPSTREESYVLQIEIATMVPTDGRSATSRLKTLIDEVWGEFRDASTGQPSVLDLGGQQILKGGIGRIDVNVVPLADQGYGATADLYMRVYARI